MAGTVAAAAKVKLIGTGGVLRALSGMDGVTFAYTPPDANFPRELITAGKIGGSVELVGMKGSARVKRAESLSLPLFIRVAGPGDKDTQVTDTRAVALSALIEDYIAANPRLDGNVANLKHCSVTGVDLDSYTEKEFSVSTVTLTLGLTSVLS